jgi:hypothetical protein
MHNLFCFSTVYIAGQNIGKMRNIRISNFLEDLSLQQKNYCLRENKR